MKIAVIGKGKTGGELLGLIPKDSLLGPYSRSNPINIEELNQADVGIAFITGPVFLELIPTLLKTKTPLLIGATGVEVPKELDQQLKEAQTSWMIASNFSAGIQLFRQLIKRINSLKATLPGFEASLLDIHHIHKLDSPSGTAKSLAKWSDFEVNITDKREGDVVGIHELTLNFPQETLSIKHDAKNRALFAQGALNLCPGWAKMPLGHGLFYIEDYYDSLLEK